MNKEQIEQEFEVAERIIRFHPVIESSPADIRRAGKTLEEYLADWPVEEQKFYKDYYEDEI